jgi:hypothetical protein
LCQSDADCNVLGVQGRLCATDASGAHYCVDAAPDDSGLGGAGGEASISTTDGAAGEPSLGPTVGVIGPSGGTFGIAGVTITVPPGALDHDVSISISQISSAVSGALGQASDIGPSGTKFLQPAILRFNYTDDELEGQPASAFAVSTVVGKAWVSVSAPATDPFAHTISGTISHLSPYALAPYSGAAANSGTGGAANQQGEGGAGNQPGAGGASSAGSTSTATAGSANGGSGAAGGAGGVSCLAAPMGLVSWWRAEGTPADAVGPNNAQASGQVAYVTGKVGKAFQFQNMAYLVATSVGLPSGAADRTLEAWVRVPSPVPPATEVMFFYGSQAAPENDFSEINGGLRGPDNTSILFNGTPQVSSNAWIHVAYTLQAGAGTLYVNGVTRANVPASGINTPMSSSLYIGGFPAAGAMQGFAGGAVDELSIYDRALSGQEITAIYRSTGGKCVN